MTRALLSVYHPLAYYFSFVLFGTCGLGLSLFCFGLGWRRTTPRTEHAFQRLLHRHFRAWLWWLETTHLVIVRYEGFGQFRPTPGLVLVANHPGLTDITYLLARLPQALCVFKPAIRRNPVLGATARRAGYLGSDGGHEMLRQAADKVAAGNTLIVFPEGTRSQGTTLNPLKSGFVLVARRARVPIQLVRIDYDSELLIKGRPWWKLPRLPARVNVTLGPCLPPPIDEKTETVVHQVESWLRGDGLPLAVAAAPSPAPVSACWQPTA